MVIKLSELVTVAWQPHNCEKMDYLYGLYSFNTQQETNLICAFPYGVLGQVCYLNVSIPDL